MKLKSRAFDDSATIPKKYSCQGEDINPQLDIGQVPEAAKSLALIVEDPDAPAKTFCHWIVYDIPADTRVIEPGKPPGTEGVNDFGRLGYSGPCPPPESTDRYFFKLYALDDYLDLPQGVEKIDVQNAMKGHVLDRAELIGLFAKS